MLPRLTRGVVGKSYPVRIPETLCSLCIPFGLRPRSVCSLSLSMSLFIKVGERRDFCMFGAIYESSRLNQHAAQAMTPFTPRLEFRDLNFQNIYPVSILHYITWSKNIGS
jgi:hypothetical protein